LATLHTLLSHVLLHLRHHRWVHLSRPTGHHRSHGVPLRHPHPASLHAHLHHLLHVLEVLLHHVPIFCHLRGAEVLTRTRSAATLLAVIAIVAHLLVSASSHTPFAWPVIVLPTVKLPATVEAPSSPCAVFMHIAARLSALDFHRLVLDKERLVGKRALDSGVAIEGYETEAAGAHRVFVHHERRVDNAAELREEVAEVVFGGVGAHPTDEYLCCALLFFPGNGALGIDLDNVSLVC
jgi:hypothetical protein